MVKKKGSSVKLFFRQLPETDRCRVLMYGAIPNAHNGAQQEQ